MIWLLKFSQEESFMLAEYFGKAIAERRRKE